jgi:hypothetical protein
MPMNAAPHATVLLFLDEDNLPALFPLLHQGFQLTATVGCDIQCLLCDQFKLDPEYLADRISTIFLDGKPVDDVASAVVRDGATLALSAAMPGLVGATFRKAGHLAPFRGEISYQKEAECPTASQDGWITLKLFNLLLSELGPLFLKRGIWIGGGVLRDALNRQPPGLQPLCKKIELNGGELPPERMTQLEWISPDTRYFLKVNCDV